MDHPLSPAAQRIAQRLQDPEPLRWVFAGDSITHGAAHTHGYRDYTEHFSERLRWELWRKRDCVIKTGVSSWKITDVLEDLAWSISSHRPHIVSLNFGMNDCTLKAEGRDLFLSSYREVLRQIREECGAEMILHVPNGTLSVAANYHPYLPAYQEAVRSLASENDVVLVDHGARWAEAPETMIFWMADGIHPNEYGHRVMARMLMQSLGIDDANSPTCRLFVP